MSTAGEIARMGAGSGRGLALLLAIAVAVLGAACNLAGQGEEAGAEGGTEVERLTLELNAARTEATQLRLQIDQVKVDMAARVEAEAAEAAGGVISLERARLVAIKHAQENREVYPAAYRDVDLVWEIDSSLEQAEFYYVFVAYRPYGFKGTSGLEEFIMDKRGSIQFRQVVEEPVPEAAPPAEPPAEQG